MKAVFKLLYTEVLNRKARMFYLFINV